VVAHDLKLVRLGEFAVRTEKPVPTLRRQLLKLPSIRLLKATALSNVASCDDARDQAIARFSRGIHRLRHRTVYRASWAHWTSSATRSAKPANRSACSPISVARSSTLTGAAAVR
jgi:hypothetical protein